MTEKKYGLLLCRCRGEVSNYIPLEEIAEKFNKNAHVKFTYVSNSLCDAIERNEIHKLLTEFEPEGIVFAGCSPRYYQEYFRCIATESDINSGKVGFANIREQLAWVHKKESLEFLKARTELAIDVSFKSLENTDNFVATKLEILDDVTVIGGGVGGIQTALSISRASQSTKIHIIERGAYIGGEQLKYSKAFPRDECSSCALSPLISEISVNPRIKIHDRTEVLDSVGRVGDYTLKIQKRPRYVTTDCIACGNCADACPETVISMDGTEIHKAIYLPFQGSIPICYTIDEYSVDNCRNNCDQPCLNVCPSNAIDLDMKEIITEHHTGMIVIATGAAVHTPIQDDNVFGFGQSSDVLTLHQYEKLLAVNSRWKGDIRLFSDEDKQPSSIAFLLCVERSALGYCSKYCCSSSAAAIRQTVEKLPNTKIYVFYQDQYSDSKFADDYIKSTRKLHNVQWIRAMPRKIDTDEDLMIHVPVSGGMLELKVDMLILATGMVPHEKTPFLRHIFGLDASKDGFFSEFDLLFSPVSTNDMGKFVIGTASGPKTIPETTISAYAAGSQIVNILNKKTLELPVSITEVNEDLCSGCGICVKTCTFHANSINLDRNVAEVDITRCRGCGNCVTACPAKARDLIEFSDAAINKSIDLLGNSPIKSNKGEPSMLAFLCNGCGYSTADNVGLSGAGLTYSPNLSIIRVPCSGRVDARQMLHALSYFDGVMIGGCKLHSCNYSVGNFDSQKRVYLLQGAMEAANINPERLKIEYYSPTETERFCKSIDDFEKKIQCNVIIPEEKS